MNMAAEFVKKLNRKNSDTQKIEADMKAACSERVYGEPTAEQGWGEIEIWKFSDGSYVSYDGRGYVAQQSAI